MNWYYNNDGTADGPHDEHTIQTFVNEGRISARTLIWNTEVTLWREAGEIQPSWWEKPSVKPTETSDKVTDTYPEPIAPTQNGTNNKALSLFKRLFGR